VTVFGRVNSKHLGAGPGTQAYSAWDRPLWVGWYEYLARAGGVNTTGTSRDTLTCIHSLAVFAGAWLNRLASGDQRRRTESGSALEACSRLCAVQIQAYYFTILVMLF